MSNQQNLDMYTNLRIQNFTKEEFLEYISRYLIDDIKLNADHVGKFIVTQTREVEKEIMPMIGVITTSRNSSKLIWAAFEIGWYNRELFKENEYKVHLTPIGADWAVADERSWYNCDIESRLTQHNALLVDDPLEAYDIKQKLNELKIKLA